MTLLKQIYLTGIKTAAQAVGLDADAFVQFAHEDDTADSMENQKAPLYNEEKPVHWSGAATLQGGDTGTRNEQLGLPRSQSV